MNNARGDEYSADLVLAHELADLADSISLPRFQANDLQISTKPDSSHVTDADLAVEKALREHLSVTRPEDGILGEEFGSEGATSRQWIIDPIDGTANYLRGVPNWATLISLAIDGHPILGVVSAPAFSTRWWAAQGTGAWIAEDGKLDRTMHVSRTAHLADASLSFQSITQWEDAGRLPQLLDLVHEVWRDRAYGDMWSYMLLADGLIDIVGEFGVKEYDIAAVWPIIREAGGQCSSHSGASSLDQLSSFATNGLIHNQVLAVVNR